ncbi:MAG TPA: hypothetical protein DDZ42_02225 [Candidatus Rokubacteria bacterium]|nr:hypothetical protein [Candidatus Rokubacteria bacterium]HBH00727.1 hypothetical protein [Candidatus Rokubacteria bacterium]
MTTTSTSTASPRWSTWPSQDRSRSRSIAALMVLSARAVVFAARLGAVPRRNPCGRLAGRRYTDCPVKRGLDTSAKSCPVVTEPGWFTPRWYVLRTRSRHEKVVRDQLAQREVEVFLPLAERWSRWKDRRQRIAVPLFPGYCFARFLLTERYRLLNLVGVATLVGFAGKPEPVPDPEIEAIQRLAASTLQYDPHPFLTEGMDVEVVRGPLAGVRGKLLRKDRTTRLVLAVTLIRQAAVLEIHPADIVPVR